MRDKRGFVFIGFMTLAVVLITLLSFFTVRSIYPNSGSGPAAARGPSPSHAGSTSNHSDSAARTPAVPSNRLAADPVILLAGTWEATGQGSKIFTGSMGSTYLRFLADHSFSMMTIIDYDAYWKTHPYIYEAVKEMDIRRGLPVPEGVAWGVAEGHWRIVRPHVVHIELTQTLTGAPPPVTDMVVRLSGASGARIVGMITYKAGEALQGLPREEPPGTKGALPLVLHRTSPVSPPDGAARTSGTRAAGEPLPGS